jgi:hypothetical protein
MDHDGTINTEREPADAAEYALFTTCSCGWVGNKWGANLRTSPAVAAHARAEWMTHAFDGDAPPVFSIEGDDVLAVEVIEAYRLAAVRRGLDDSAARAWAAGEQFRAWEARGRRRAPSDPVRGGGVASVRRPTDA